MGKAIKVAFPILLPLVQEAVQTERDGFSTLRVCRCGADIRLFRNLLRDRCSSQKHYVDIRLALNGGTIHAIEG
jgi:hypothetical protein